MSPLLRIITVIMSPLLRIITRSIIRNNGFIITYYRPGQLGDESTSRRRAHTLVDPTHSLTETSRRLAHTLVVVGKEPSSLRVAGNEPTCSGERSRQRALDGHGMTTNMREMII